MNKEIIELIYDIDDEICKQKSLIEIANLICENDDNADTKLYLILDILNKQNENIYEKYDTLLRKIQNLAEITC